MVFIHYYGNGNLTLNNHSLLLLQKVILLIYIIFKDNLLKLNIRLNFSQQKVTHWCIGVHLWLFYWNRLLLSFITQQCNVIWIYILHNLILSFYFCNKQISFIQFIPANEDSCFSIDIELLYNINMYTLLWRCISIAD